ncbi:MAG TPA: trypsin-like peptidase domain-containing protein [Bacteroidota bacterium]
MVEQLRRATVLVGGERGGAGSGVIIDAKGTIVTNAHVARAQAMHVQLWDGRTYKATVKHRPPGRDLAILAVPAAGLPAAPLGDSGALRVGQILVAVGNPFGFIGAVTTGILHAYGPIRGLGPGSWVQSDLQLAPGNSGGPLADAAGNVVGINTMIVGRLALALPSNTVRECLAPKEERPTRRVLGVLARPIPVNLNGARHTGLLLLEVESGSPAEAASLLPGDTITGINGLPCESMDLAGLLEAKEGPLMQLQFVRGGMLRKTSVLLRTNKAA